MRDHNSLAPLGDRAPKVGYSVKTTALNWVMVPGNGLMGRGVLVNV